MPAAARGRRGSLLNQMRLGRAEIPISTFKPIHSDLGGWREVVFKLYKNLSIICCAKCSNTRLKCVGMSGEWFVWKRKAVCVLLAGSGLAARRNPRRSWLKIQMLWLHLELLQQDFGWSPRRLTPGQGCPGDPPCFRGHPFKQPGHLPGVCMSHSCGNHSAHSQPLTTKHTELVWRTLGAGRAEGC